MEKLTFRKLLEEMQNEIERYENEGLNIEDLMNNEVLINLHLGTAQQVVSFYNNQIEKCDKEYPVWADVESELHSESVLGGGYGENGNLFIIGGNSVLL